MTEIEAYLVDIEKLCTRYNVKTLYAFGSVLNDQYSAESDIDFLVNFNAVDLDHYADNYFALKFALESILKRPIDLIEEQAIRNPYFRQVVSKQRKLVYGY